MFHLYAFQASHDSMGPISKRSKMASLLYAKDWHCQPLGTNGVWHTHFKKPVIGFNDDMKVKRPLGHCFQHL